MFKSIKSKIVSGVQKVKGAMAAFALMAAVGVSSLIATPAHAATGGGVDFTGVTLPFTVTDMLTTATNFLTMYGQWIALALGVLFAPVLYALAMKLVNAARAKVAKS